MEALRKAGLFGRGLTPVNTPGLVKWYNQCLEQIAIAPTRLTEFSIDGWGWSPEIAAEKATPYYMSHDLANSFAIILSPEQFKKPIYFPYHSFDRKMMERFFKQSARQIETLTQRTGLWLDVDTAVQQYVEPEE